MKHNTLNRLDEAGDMHAVGKVAMSRQEHLERWALLLGREPTRVLNSLEGTEYREGEVQARMRCADSPISVAFADSVLRVEGLKDDTYGEARQFFDLSDWELHNIVCYCNFGVAMTAGTVASRVRSSIKNGQASTSRLARALQALTG